jgi:hypothetical protein
MTTLRDRLRATGWIERMGFGLFGAGSALDLAYHLSPATWLPTVEQYAGPDGVRAHEITLIGMLVVLASLVRLGLARAHHGSGRKEGMPGNVS